MTDYEMNVAMTAKEQLFASVPANVIMSWGITQIGATVHEGMPTLILCVNGFLHKGPVFVCYNGSTDLYDILLTKNHTRKVEVLRKEEDVYADELGRVIDRLIEKDCSQEEYEKMVDESLKS